MKGLPQEQSYLCRIKTEAEPGRHIPGRKGQTMTDTMKIMIRLIRAYWWYEEGHLEAMTEDEVRDIYNRLIDWIG